jgi:hypothetical protein
MSMSSEKFRMERKMEFGEKTMWSAGPSWAMLNHGFAQRDTSLLLEKKQVGI